MSATTFTLCLLDGQSQVRIDGVSSFIAADSSGQFGLLPGHMPLLTFLEPGLFRYRLGAQADWSYGASAGGTLSSRGTDIRVVSRRFLQGGDPEQLQARLDDLLDKERTMRLSTRDTVGQLDLAFLRRMQELAQQAGT